MEEPFKHRDNPDATGAVIIRSIRIIMLNARAKVFVPRCSQAMCRYAVLQERLPATHQEQTERFDVVNIVYKLGRKVA